VTSPDVPRPQLSQALHVLVVETRGAGFTDISRDVRRWLAGIGANDGLLTVFVRHTSASLVIQENADPAVRRDLLDSLDRLAPRDHAYAHATEGPDDMPAHIKSMLTATSIGIPVSGSVPVLGTWQGLYLVEHRDAPHRREVVMQFIGTLTAMQPAIR
jgi:secondary thiamine-phosphate synthase enzyme